MNADPPSSFVRLLDHRPLGDLVRMNDAERRALLDELLDRPAAEATWQALWELFGNWPANEARSEALVAADVSLVTWPDRMRSVSSSDRRLYESTPAGRRLSAIAALVHSISVDRREGNGSVELYAIAASEKARGLVALQVTRSEIDSQTWRAFAESPHLTRLSELEVTRTMLLEESVAALFRGTALGRVERLGLVDAGVRVQDVVALQQEMLLPCLRDLELSSDGLGDRGAEALAQSPWLRQMERLTLRDSFLHARAIRGLLLSDYAERLRRLDVADNRVDEADRPELLALAVSKGVELLL